MPSQILRIIFRNLEYLSSGKEMSLATKIRLKLRKRHNLTSVKFLKSRFLLTDAPSFVSMYEEIFLKGIYEFRSDAAAPVIVDCGANIGLSIAYFKKMYPKAQIHAFEPDKKIFGILKDNLNALGIKDAALHNKAIWINNEDLTFESQGGLSGKLSDDGTHKVKAFRLKDLLNEQTIDMLKIDIEGAEYEVLKDCKDALSNVRHLFVEYHSEINATQKLDEILKIFTQAGFRYQIHEAFTSPRPFMAIKSQGNNDLQLNIFGYR